MAWRNSPLVAETRRKPSRRLILAAQAQRRERLGAEAAALSSDPEDVAEIRAVREEMDDLRAW